MSSNSTGNEQIPSAGTEDANLPNTPTAIAATSESGSAGNGKVPDGAATIPTPAATPGNPEVPPSPAPAPAPTPETPSPVPPPAPTSNESQPPTSRQPTALPSSATLSSLTLSSPPTPSISSSSSLLTSSISRTSTFRTSTRTSSASASSTSTVSSIASTTAPAAAAPAPHRNVAAIAAPVAVGVFLFAVLVLILCCWRRSKSFGGSHRRTASSVSEASSVLPYNIGAQYVPKVRTPRSPEPFMLSPRQVPVSPKHEKSASHSSKAVSESEGYENGDPVPVFEPGELPGLGIGTPPASHLSHTFLPPSNSSEKRPDSPTAPFQDAPTEPLDVTSGRRPGWPRRPVGMTVAASKRHASIDRDDVEWPLPSPFTDMTPESESASNTPPPARRDYANAKSPWPMPSTDTQRHLNEAVAEPSAPRPAGGIALVSPTAEHPPGPSPFGDVANTAPNTKTGNTGLLSHTSSWYTQSTSSEGHQRLSTMLRVPERGRMLNEDGISEFSVEIGEDERGGSRLHQRDADEVSVVSSINDNDRELEISSGSGAERGSGSGTDAGENRTSDGAMTALPQLQE